MNNEHIIKQSDDFRLILRKSLCARPNDLYHLELENQQIKNNKVEYRSVYSFFLTKEEIQNLSQSLLNE